MISMKYLFKVIYKNKFFIIIYLAVFVGMSFLFVNSNNSQTYSSSKVNISFIDKDNTIQSENFRKYLEKYCVFKEAKNPLDEIIYMHIDLEVEVNKGYLNNVLKKEQSVKIKITQPSQNTHYMESIIKKYNNMLYSYYSLGLGLTDEKINDLIVENLNGETEVIMLKENQTKLSNITQFYIFLSYIIVAVLVYIIGLVVIVFNEKNIKKKMSICGNINKEKIGMICGLALFSLLFSLILIIMGLLFYGKFDMSSVYFGINVIAICFTVTIISYFISIFVKNKEVVANISTVLSLAISFLSGVFVPKMILGENVINFSKLFPIYWYNEMNYAVLEGNIGSSYFISLSVILGYGVLFLGLSIFFHKKMINRGNE